MRVSGIRTPRINTCRSAHRLPCFRLRSLLPSPHCFCFPFALWTPSEVAWGCRLTSGLLPFLHFSNSLQVRGKDLHMQP